MIFQSNKQEHTKSAVSKICLNATDLIKYKELNRVQRVNLHFSNLSTDITVILKENKLNKKITYVSILNQYSKAVKCNKMTFYYIKNYERIPFIW